MITFKLDKSINSNEWQRVALAKLKRYCNLKLIDWRIQECQIILPDNRTMIKYKDNANFFTYN